MRAHSARFLLLAFALAGLMACDTDGASPDLSPQDVQEPHDVQEEVSETVGGVEEDVFHPDEDPNEQNDPDPDATEDPDPGDVTEEEVDPREDDPPLDSVADPGDPDDSEVDVSDPNDAAEDDALDIEDPYDAEEAADAEEEADADDAADLIDGDTSDTEDVVDPAPLPTPHFTLVTPLGLEEVFFHWDTIDPLTYGAGLAFVDTTGTGTLDLFVGQYNDNDAPACIYRNVSTPGVPAFEPIEEVCGTLGAYLGALPVDLTGDGRDELFLYGLASAGLLRFTPEISYTPIDVRGSEDGPMQGCLSVSAMAVDVNLDGRPEVVVGCAGVAEGISDIFEQMESPDFRGLTEFKPNVVFRLNEHGELVAAAGSPYNAMADIGSSLAMGPVELGHDGRDAIVFANDSHSTIFSRWTWLRPGVVKFRCIADASCDYNEFTMAPTREAWGAYMGTTQVYVGDEPYIYLSDWGPNRLLRWIGSEFVDEARQRNARVGVRNGQLAVSWAILVDDFNYSGLDDIFVSNGLIFWDMQAYREQVDSLLVQQPDGTFLELNEEIGLVPGEPEVDDTLGTAYNARGGALVDLDGDGRLEVVLANIAGPLIVYREDLPITDAQGPRCTLLPRERVTAPLGLLFGIRGEDEAGFRIRNAQGQMNIGLPRSLVTRWRTGSLRFPSGAIVDYDCGDSNGPLVLEEPDWLAVELLPSGTEVQVRLQRDWLPADHRSVLTLHLRHLDGSFTQEVRTDVPPHATLDVAWPETAEAVLFQHDGFWVRRWFQPDAMEAQEPEPNDE